MTLAWRPGAVRVRVPATSANLGPGYDSFGLALDLHDEVEVRVTAGGLAVAVTGEGVDDLPRDEGHLVVRALLAALDRLGGRPPGLALRATNRIPHGRGLGSSAAAIVAGVRAATALVALRQDTPALSDEAMLDLASALEGHPDNVAACLLGGFTVAWTGPDGVRAVRHRPAPGLLAVVAVPSGRLATETARGLLPATVPHADAAHAAARAALVVTAVTARPDLLLEATEDRLHQPYRAPAMPDSACLLARLRAAGVPAVVSGAGPSVLALVPRAGAERAAALARNAAPDGWVVLVLPPAARGATVLPAAGRHPPVTSE